MCVCVCICLSRACSVCVCVFHSPRFAVSPMVCFGAHARACVCERGRERVRERESARVRVLLWPGFACDTSCVCVCVCVCVHVCLCVCVCVYMCVCRGDIMWTMHTHTPEVVAVSTLKQGLIKGQSIHMIIIAPLSPKTAPQSGLELRFCVFAFLLSAPLVLGVPTKTRLESNRKKSKRRLVYDCAYQRPLTVRHGPG